MRRWRSCGCCTHTHHDMHMQTLVSLTVFAPCTLKRKLVESASKQSNNLTCSVVAQQLVQAATKAHVTFVQAAAAGCLGEGP